MNGKRKLAVLVVMTACLGLACSAHRRAGTGDVAFRLLWDGISDLDLFVEGPDGGCIYFVKPRSETGGVLDVDCNAGTDQMCDEPIENVFWPAGTAPAGRYVYWVYSNSLLEAEAPLSYEVQILRGSRVAWRHQGTIETVGEISVPLAYQFGQERDTPPSVSGRPPSSCDDWIWKRGGWQLGQAPVAVPAK